ncbi:MAG TPA: hypothetical protein VNC50_22715, partial [Planctomycetia bacterium]|nr:hypothetical protein [Planctomycetia bacterium]
MAGGTRLLTKLGAAALGFATLLAGESPAQTAPTGSAAVGQASASSPASPAQNSAKDETGPKKTPLPKALDAKPRDSATPPPREVRVETFL